MLYVLLVATLCLSALPLQLGEAAQRTTYSIVVMDNGGNLTKKRLQWEPLLGKFLNAQLTRLGANFTVAVSAMESTNLTRAVALQEADFAYTSIGHGSLLVHSYPTLVAPFLSSENARLGKALSVHGGVLYTYNTSSIWTFEDCLKSSARLAAVTFDSFGGYLTQLKEFVDRGLPIAPLKEKVVFLGSHENVLAAVNAGNVECGFVRTDRYEGALLSASGPAVNNIRQIGQKTGIRYATFPFRVSTKLYPEWFMLSQRRVPYDDSDIIGELLQSIRQTDPEAIAAEFSRFFPPSSIDNIIELLCVTGSMDCTVPSSLGGGAVAGIVVAVCMALALAGLLAWKLRRRFEVAAAPKDASKPFCIVFVSLKHESLLWEQLPHVMPATMERAAALLRQHATMHDCYMVKRIGASTMIAARGSREALEFAASIRGPLNDPSWTLFAIEQQAARATRTQRKVTQSGMSTGSVNSEERSSGVPEKAAAEQHGVRSAKHERSSVSVQSEERSSGVPEKSSQRSPSEASRESNILQRVGISFSVGVHFGAGNIEYDASRNAYDYSGPVVDGGALVVDAACGGQTLVSAACGCGSFSDPNFADFTSVRIRKKTVALKQFNAPGQPVVVFERAADADVEAHTDSLAAQLEKHACGVTLKTVTVLEALCPQLQNAASADSDELHECSRTLQSQVKRIEELVEREKGHLQSLDGGRLTVTFNAARPAAQAAMHAFSVASSLQCEEGLCLGDIACGISSSKALVGNVQNREIVVGRPVSDASHLAQLCKTYTDEGIHVLTTDGALGEVELFATVQFIDLIKMPDSAKISGLVAIMGMKSQEDNEWMYELESSQLNNPFRVSNAIYKKLLAGSTPDSPEVRDLVAALLLEHEEQLQSQSHATHVNESPDAKSSGCVGTP